MFGLLPRTKSILTANAIAFRFDKASSSVQAILKEDSRVVAFDKNKTR